MDNLMYERYMNTLGVHYNINDVPKSKTKVKLKPVENTFLSDDEDDLYMDMVEDDLQASIQETKIVMEEVAKQEKQEPEEIEAPKRVEEKKEEVKSSKTKSSSRSKAPKKRRTRKSKS